jgi:hypothetical protein
MCQHDPVSALKIAHWMGTALVTASLIPLGMPAQAATFVSGKL